MPATAVNLAALSKTVSADRVLTSAEACQKYEVDGLAPAAVAEPESPKEIAEIIRWAREQKAALLPSTSGAFLPWGNPPAAVDVVLSLRRMNRVLAYDPGDLTLSVEAGITLPEIEKLLVENNLFLPADPPFAGRAALGGLLAANVNGPLRHTYGTWRDYVVGLRFVTGEGKEVKSGGRVVKNVAGYDLTKLLIGSLGSLGIITEINLRVFPRPAGTATFILGFETLEAALDYRLRVMQSPMQPTAIELLSGAAATLLNSPHLPEAKWLLLLSCGGVAAVIERHEKDLGALTRETPSTSFTKLTGEEEKTTWQAVRNFAGTAQARSPYCAAIKCPLPLTQLAPFITRAVSVAERYELPTAVTAHAGVAVAYIWYLPTEGNAEDIAFRVGQTATETIHAGNNLQGRVSLPWCFPEVKQNVNPWGPLKDDHTLMQKLKQKFDPGRVLNPGRFAGGL
jgi:glycolate oxidase FAD binding subunit